MAENKESILFVCAANVCRSPLMQYGFQQAIAGASDITVGSAGVSARDGASMCDLARTFLTSAEALAVAGDHAARAVDESMLQSDLIVVASRAERGALAQLDPEVRSRVFTLTEAVLLGRSILSSGATAPSSSLEDYAVLLDGQRGMVTIPRPARPRRYAPIVASTNPLDLPDGHQRRRGKHRQVLRRIDAEIDELASQVLRRRGVRHSS